MTTTTNSSVTGIAGADGLTSGGPLGTPSSGVATNLTGTAAGLTAGNVTTNANLTGHVTSTGNAAVLGSFTLAQLNTALSGADVAQLGANTFTAAQTFAENAGIVLDAALSADGKYSGVVENGTAGAALAFGEVCYLASTGKWLLAKADAAATSSNQLGMCVLAAAADTNPTTMLLFGKVRADVLFDTFTVGAPVYISAATAGKTVTTAPTGTVDFVVRQIGQAEDANTVFFRPDNIPVTMDASSKIKTVGGVAVATAAGGFTLGTPVASTSGTSIDFTGIPAGTKFIAISFSSTSTNSTARKWIQLGDAGGPETTGYLSNGTRLVDGVAVNTIAGTAAFAINSIVATDELSGVVYFTLENSTSFRWAASGSFALSNGDATFTLCGTKALSAELTQIRITTATGTDTFDLGEINVSYSS